MPIVNSCLDGYNGTIFAYGQTGSGKTHTIQGPIDYENVTDLSKEELENRGIMPWAFEYLFYKLKEMSDDVLKHEYMFTVHCSYLEIYNEKVMDLLDPTSSVL